MNQQACISVIPRMQKRTIRRITLYLSNDLPKRMSFATIILGIILCALVVTATPASAQSCRSSTYIPGLSSLTLQHVNGTTISLQRDSRNYYPTVHVWINGSYVGEKNIPLTLAAGEI